MRDYNNPSKKDVKELLDSIIEKTPRPNVDLNSDFTMLVSQIESNKFYGKMLIGRVASGMIKVGDRLNALDGKGVFIEGGKVLKIIRRFGTKQVINYLIKLELTQGGAGDIISISGFEKATVTHTLNTEKTNIVIPVLIL